jgi:hypothetical protein
MGFYFHGTHDAEPRALEADGQPAAAAEYINRV